MRKAEAGGRIKSGIGAPAMNRLNHRPAAMPHLAIRRHFGSWHRLPADVGLDHWQDANATLAEGFEVHRSPVRRLNFSFCEV
jgi:hypothetical protein